MIGRRRADDVERLKIDQLRRRRGEVFLGIGRIVLVRRKHPHPAGLDHLERLEGRGSSSYFTTSRLAALWTSVSSGKRIRSASGFTSRLL